jgi:hypothetical protein
MSGRHARPAGAGDSKPALRNIIAVAAGLGGIGLAVYLVLAGNDAEFWGLLWLVWLGWTVFTVQSVVLRKRRDYFWPWAAIGQLFLATDNLARSLAEGHMWLARDKHVLMLISRSTEWAAIACTGIAIIAGIKSRELLWSRRKSRPATGEPD